MQRRMITIGVVACVLALVIGGLCLAQPPQGGRQRGGDQGGQRGERPAFDPAQMQQRRAEFMKQQLGASDDEWKVIEPRLNKVMELNRDAMAGGRGGMFGFGGMRPGRGGDQGATARGGERPRFPGQENRQPSAVEKAADTLSTTLENQSASPETIKQQLTALRAARTKAQNDLAAAQQELRQILSLRQEAVLVLNGTLN